MRDPKLRTITALTVWMTLASFVVSCSHMGQGGPEAEEREPANASAYEKSCGKLSATEVKSIKVLFKSDMQMDSHMKVVSDWLHLTKVDKTIDTDRMDIKWVIAPHKVKGVTSKFDLMLSTVLNHCSKIREDQSPYSWLEPKKQPKLWAQLQDLCGKPDSYFKNYQLPHPKTLRDDWTNSKLETPIDTRLWVRATNGIIDASGNLIGPSKVAGLCSNFKYKNNIEDHLEGVLLCVDAIALNSMQYDETLGSYVLTDEGDLQQVTRSKEFGKCISAYADGQVVVADDGTPTGPVIVAKSSGSKGGRGGDGKSGDATAGTSGRPTAQATPAPSPGFKMRVGLADRVSYTMPTPGEKPRPYCMPGDPEGTWGDCKKDSCMSDFSYQTRKHQLPIPISLTSKDMQQLYKDKRSEYVYYLSRHQTRVLGQGYIVAALQQSWLSPQKYNENLKRFPAACKNSRLRKDLETMMEKEYFGATVDGAYDSQFPAQTEVAETKGERMIKTMHQIEGIRKLTSLLRYDMGADEVQTVNVPHWLAAPPIGKLLNFALTAGFFKIPYLSDMELPLPFIHYYDGAPVLISFGDTGRFQCNMFSVMSHETEYYSSRLLTLADKQVRKLLANKDFVDKTFCTNDPECAFPAQFQTYLDWSDPQTLATLDPGIAKGTAEKMLLSQWCQIRDDARNALHALEYTLVTKYPGLAHAEMEKQCRSPNEDKETPCPLYERLQKRKTYMTDAKLAKLAQTNADAALPSMQDDLLQYVGKLCDDLNTEELDSTYMAVLNRNLVQGYDYCREVDLGESSALRMPCEWRTGFMACKLAQEATAWKAKKDLPAFYHKVAMVGLDALFIYSAASGGLSAMFTPRGLIVGGITGLGFTGLNYAVSYAISQYSEASWNKFNTGVAAATLEGVDSYANAVASIAAQQKNCLSTPSACATDFLFGFMLGAAFSGAKAKGGINPAVEGPGGKGGGKGPSGPKVVEEVLTKVSEFAEKADGGGVKFSPKSLGDLKGWMMERAAKDPTFTQKLMQNLGEALNKLSDAEYARLFESTVEGRLSLSRLRRAAEVRLGQAAQRVGKVLTDFKAKLASKKLSGTKLSELEQALVKSDFKGVDVANVAKELGPREAALLAEAAETALKEVAGEKPTAKAGRLREFLNKLCQLSLSCPSLAGVGGCGL